MKALNHIQTFSFAFVIAIVIIILFIVLLIKRSATNTSKDSDTPWPLGVNNNFLSAAEQSFFGVLRQITGNNYLICPKVNLGDVLFIQKGIDRSLRQSLLNRINRKHIDFILLDPLSLSPVLAIELDDSSHQKISAQKRDEVKDRALKDANLKLVRIPVKTTYNIHELTDLIAAELLTVQSNDESIIKEQQNEESAGEFSDNNKTNIDAQQTVICPKCNIEMVKRKASRGSKAGQSFWGCPNFPNCRETKQDIAN